jgi:hypothetical protein
MRGRGGNQSRLVHVRHSVVLTLGASPAAARFLLLYRRGHRSVCSDSPLRVFHQRLTQAVATVRRASDEAGVVPILHAIDHAAVSAEKTQSASFARDLLRSLVIEW